MNAASRRNIRPGPGDLAFVGTVAAAFISALTTSPRPFSPQAGVVLLALGALYLVGGTYGWLFSERAASPSAFLAYFAIQLSLGATILYVSRFAGFMSLILLPLVGHAVAALPRRWMLVVCALVIVALVVPAGLLSGWTNALQGGLTTYLAGIVFVVIFTQMAVRAEQARDEVARLAVELSAANRKLHDYAVQIEELATTRERNRLAREIHDTLGHYLTVINVQIEAARAVMERDRVQALDALQKAQTLTQEGLAEVRRSIAAMRASPVENRPLPETVAALVNESRAAGILTELVVAGVPRSLAPQAELTLYRAAQEGLTNVRKHAHASRADLTLDYRGDTMVRLVVQDNGVGGSETNGGFGLLGLRERVQLLGGEVRVRTAAGDGFTLEVGVPG